MAYLWYGKEAIIRSNSLNVTIEGLGSTHIRLPFEIPDLSNDEIFFMTRMMKGNPMITEKGQEWMKNNGLNHISMITGDVIQKNDVFFVRDDIGWRIIE